MKINCEVMMAKKPSSNDSKKTTTFQMRTTKEWLERVEKQAERRQIGVAAYIRQAVVACLEKDESTQPKTD